MKYCHFWLSRYKSKSQIFIQSSMSVYEKWIDLALLKTLIHLKAFLSFFPFFFFLIWIDLCEKSETKETMIFINNINRKINLRIVNIVSKSHSALLEILWHEKGSGKAAKRAAREWGMRGLFGRMIRKHVWEWYWLTLKSCQAYTLVAVTT